MKIPAYQTFIDLLTNHGKTTSSGFLQLYSTLSEAPDPYPLLEASVDSLLVSEETLPRVISENEHLQISISNLTQELDAAEKDLEHERFVRKQLEESLDNKSQEIQASWQAVLEEKKDNWEAKEKNLEEKIEDQERLLNEIKANYEVSQRLEHDHGDSESQRASTTAAELEIVSSDLERTSHRLAEVEARNERLRIDLAQASTGKSKPSNNEEDPSLSRLRSENASLMRKLDSSRIERDSESRKWDNRIRSLERDIHAFQRDKEELRERLQKWQDYPEIKRELEVFKVCLLSIAIPLRFSCCSH